MHKFPSLEFSLNLVHQFNHSPSLEFLESSDRDLPNIIHICYSLCTGVPDWCSSLLVALNMLSCVIVSGARLLIAPELTR